MRYLRPDSRFVHTKTDIVCFAVLTVLGLGVVINGTFFGLGGASLKFLIAGVLGYINVFLVGGWYFAADPDSGLAAVRGAVCADTLRAAVGLFIEEFV